MAKKPKKSLYLRFNLITISAVYLLILAGGIVRSTGSGMGCPDWPKCFGSYVPPLKADQLPENYKEIYTSKRMAKNERMSGYLSALGLPGLAKNVMEGDNVDEEHAFNATKTWIEYLNRLVGVAVGLLIIGCVIASVSYIGVNNRIFVLSVATLLLVMFQGWIGSIVVSTNLLPGMITFHMILAIGLIAMLIYARFVIKKDEIVGLVTYKKYKVKRLILLCVFLFSLRFYWELKCVRP